MEITQQFHSFLYKDSGRKPLITKAMHVLHDGQKQIPFDKSIAEQSDDDQFD
jgi:hypothetical protein